MRKLCVLVIIVCTLFSPVSSTAMPVAVGDTLEGNSWGQAFVENGVGTFDKMEILWLANSDFETPAFKNFSSAAWTNLNLSSLYAIASGPDISELYFDIWFNGETQAASFLFRSSHEGVVIDFAQATKAVGGGWVFITPTTAWDTAYSAVMPEPGTMLLLGFGLIGLAGFVFCRKK